MNLVWIGTKGDLMRVSIDGGAEKLITREEFDRLRQPQIVTASIPGPREARKGSSKPAAKVEAEAEPPQEAA